MVGDEGSESRLPKKRKADLLHQPWETSVDQNKQKKLREISYVIPDTCGNCRHAKFEPEQDFGSCSMISFQHLKHVPATRELSIYRGGRCEEFYSLDPDAEKRLGAWAEFLERRKFTRSNRYKQKVRY